MFSLIKKGALNNSNHKIWKRGLKEVREGKRKHGKNVRVVSED